LTQQTSKGITYPESSDHTRLWEHMQTLATGADAIIIGNVDIQRFDASGTWNKPAGALIVDVQVVGGGGGGGGVPDTSSSQASAAGGGGGGGYARSILDAASVGSTVSVTVGTGGAGGTGSGASANAGATGNTSQFGSHCVASGGSGGSPGLQSGTTQAIGGGTPGIGTTGDVLLRGSDGGNGVVISAAPAFTGTGGAAGVIGTQRRGPAVTASAASGTAGYAPGGGGGGAVGGTAAGGAQPGGAGADGTVIVTTYIA
jgi:hypothetical protein